MHIAYSPRWKEGAGGSLAQLLGWSSKRWGNLFDSAIRLRYINSIILIWIGTAVAAVELKGFKLMGCKQAQEGFQEL